MELVTRLPGSEPLLLVESGSAVAASARATLSSVPVAGAVTVTVRDRLAPLARVANAGQVTTPAVAVPPLLAETRVTPAGSVSWTTTADRVPTRPASAPPLLAETKVTPAGSVSRTTTVAASDGPLLARVMV